MRKRERGSVGDGGGRGGTHFCCGVCDGELVGVGMNFASSFSFSLPTIATARKKKRRKDEKIHI